MASQNVCAALSYASQPLCYLTQSISSSIITGMNIVPSVENIEKVAGFVFEGLASASSKGGGTLGTGINDGVNGFFDNVNLKDIFTRGATDFGGGIGAGSDHFWESINLGKLAEDAANNLKNAADTSGPIFERISYDQIERLGRIGWNALKTYLPITLTSIIATSGAYYGARYLYKKLEDNIGKPNLATEVCYYNLASRISNAVTTTASTLIKVAVPATYAAIATKYSIALTFPALESAARLAAPKYVPSWITNFAAGIGRETSAILSTYNPISYILPNIGNAFSRFPSSIRPYRHGGIVSLSNYQLADRISIGVGALVAGGVAYSIYKLYLKSIKEEPKAIFNKDLQEVIADVTHSAYNIQKNNGFFENMLLYGPGGTGKTMIAKMIARNSGMNYVMMSGGDLAQYIKRKEHVTELNKLIKRAQNSQYPTILFIDEAESLACDRDKMTSPEHVELLNAFLNHTGEASKKLMIIMATNRLEDIDPAVLSRMDHKLHIAAPAAAERKQILDQYIVKFFSDKERKEFFTVEKVNEISAKIEGFTGRTVFKMLNAIVGKKNATKDNKLTNEVIDKVVDRFIEQERVVVGLRKKDEPVVAIPVLETADQKTTFSAKVKGLFNHVFNAKE